MAKELDNLVAEGTSYEVELQKLIEKYDKTSEDILSKLDGITSSNKAQTYLCELTRITKAHNEGRDELDKVFDRSISAKLSLIANSGLEFNKAMKYAQLDIDIFLNWNKKNWLSGYFQKEAISVTKKLSRSANN